MNRKKEPCRNFQNGSCRYGENCKFLHVSQQQPKPNAFGFGVQNGLPFAHTSQQQQKSNPYGFGVQNGSQFPHTSQQQQKPNLFGSGVQGNSLPKGGSDFGAKHQNQTKPFENKWTRSSTPSQRSDSHPQAVNHKCTDPESCKRLIAEDFEHERPLWKLTCYGHRKNGSCDISGDVSYEELQAAAYEDARHGLSLQSIVERERNLLNSKLIEFENLLRNPYVIPTNLSSSLKSQFPGTTPSATNVVQNNAPKSVSSFSQLGSSVNSGFDSRFHTAPNSAFGQPSIFGISSQTRGSFIGQPPMQQFGSAPNPNIQNLQNGIMNTGSNPFSFSPAPSLNLTSSASSQSPSTFNVPSFASNALGQATMDVPPAAKKSTEVPTDLSIWLKEEWKRGEIPEEAPPGSVL